MELESIILDIATDYVTELRDDGNYLSLVDRLTMDGAPDELRLLVAQTALTYRIQEDVQPILDIPNHVVYDYVQQQWPVYEAVFHQVMA